MLPLWSADSQRGFRVELERDLDVYAQAADGGSSAMLVFAAPGFRAPSATTPDGSRLLIYERFDDLAVLNLAKPNHLEPLLHSGVDERLGQISRRTTISEEVVDMWCYLEGGDCGAANKGCATACAKAGNPIAILDAKGSVFVAAGLKDHQPAQSLLIERMSDQVTVTGTLIKKGGVQMIALLAAAGVNHLQAGRMNLA